MKTPYFSRREVLTFLLSDDARRIEAATESECWRACWDSFFPNADDLRHDGYFLEFERVCQFFGFQPYPTAARTWRMQNANVESVLP